MTRNGVTGTLAKRVIAMCLGVWVAGAVVAQVGSQTDSGGGEAPIRRPPNPIQVPEGGGIGCPIFQPIDGVLGAGSPDWPFVTGDQIGRLTRDGITATCAAPKAFPGVFAAAGNRTFDAYTFSNTSANPECVTVQLVPDPGEPCNIQLVAYSSFDPNNVDLNYLADPGLSTGLPASTPPTFSFLVAPGGSFTVVAHDVDFSGVQGCGYTLNVACGQQVDVPTLSPWALAGLGVLLAAIGVTLARRLF